MTDSSATASKLNLEAYISVAKVRPNISPLKIGELQPVVSAFSTNYTALQRMLLLPALIAYGVAHLQNTYDHAELEVRGSLSKSGPSEPLIEPNPEISKRFLELYRQQLEENQRVLGTEEWDRKATVALQSGFQAVEFLLNHADILQAFNQCWHRI